MRALEREVFDTLWAVFESLIPDRPQTHPLGCHRRRVGDRLIFRALVIRLVTGSSWTTIEAILDYEVSDTTIRSRRDEWIEVDLFRALYVIAIADFDRFVGLDLTEVGIDGSIHKAPCGGEGTGKSPVDRAKLGWKWSVAVDAAGIPIGWAINGANRNDIVLFEPTLASIDELGLIADIETVHLDRGYDNKRARRALTNRGINDFIIQRRGTKRSTTQLELGKRWVVERMPNAPTPGYLTTANSADQPTAPTGTDTPPSNSSPPS